METITLSGIIHLEWDSWNKIKLIQPTGFKIDLVNRFKEINESFPKGLSYQINYWLSDNPCTKDEMIGGWLKKIYGDISADYEKNDYRYSSWTSGTDFDTILKIGGHDLLYELSREEGRFLIIEINVDFNQQT